MNGVIALGVMAAATAGAMAVAVGAGAVYFWAQERFLGGQYGEDEGNAVDYGGGTTGCGAGRTVLGRRGFHR